jgi:hypothetical protein
MFGKRIGCGTDNHFAIGYILCKVFIGLLFFCTSDFLQFKFRKTITEHKEESERLERRISQTRRFGSERA